MQDALDPNIGQQEIVAMKKEIHIMELRYEQLRRRQEEMIKNIERAVENRETIQLKYLPKVEKRNAGKGRDVTNSLASQSRMAQQIAGLSKTHKHTMENKMQLENSIQQKLRELDQLNGKIEESSNSLMQMENDLQSQQVGNLELRINKQRNMHAIVSQQVLAKKYEEAATSKSDLTARSIGNSQSRRTGPSDGHHEAERRTGEHSETGGLGEASIRDNRESFIELVIRRQP